MPRPSNRESTGSTSKSDGKNNSTQKKRRLSGSDLEDNVLVSMVTTWVNEDGDAAENATPGPGSKRIKRPAGQEQREENHIALTSPIETAVYSVHVTQIAYTATDMEIRHHFAAKGISIDSLRMVFDRGVDGRRQFRGVAFIDLADEQSYRLSLTLHKSLLKGRKINVRPTKSKEELTDIVATTSQKVAEKIRKHKDDKDAEEGRETKKPSPRNRDAANRRIQRKQVKKNQK
jgi:hypothetical protein